MSTSTLPESAEAFSRLLIGSFLTRHPVDAGRCLEQLDLEEASALLLEQPQATILGVLARINPDDGARILAQAQTQLSLRLIDGLDPTKSADLLARMDDELHQKLLENLPGASAREIRQILSYAPGTAGRMMDRRVTQLRGDETVEQALRRLRSVTGRRVMDLMIVDDDGCLEAVLPLHTVAVADPSTPLRQLATEEPIAVLPIVREEEVVNLLEKYRMASIAVVDLDRRLVGVIRYDELLQAVQEDAASAAQAMVGASREERALSSAFAAIKSRLPWLQINLVTAFLASAVVGVFDETIARITALAVLMPVVAGQSGNTGAQALAITQRGLALGEIRPSHIWRLIGKEAAVGAGAGIAVALVTALSVLFWSGKPVLAAVIAISMVFSMSVAAISGAVIPILLTVLGRDPATASSIILTTITDIVGFFSFLGLASLMVSALQ